MTPTEKTTIEGKVVDVLRTVFDPEIPVNIYDLGLIYRIEMHDDGTLDIDMTFTAPSCPAADFILEDVRQKVESIQGVAAANVQMVFEPEWNQSMMSEEARVELGFDLCIKTFIFFLTPTWAHWPSSTHARKREDW